MDKNKTYRALQHDKIRRLQSENNDLCHHPDEKEKQIRQCLSGKSGISILELFSGQGNMTKIYRDFGKVEKYDKTHEKTGDSYLVFHKLISEKQKYDVVDIDPYGFPNRFFPDIFLLIEDGYMFLTMPKPFVNILNGITAQHLTCYYDEKNPSLEKIKEKIKLFGLCHWRNVDFIDVCDLGRLWRLCLRVQRVKATEFTGVRNR